MLSGLTRTGLRMATRERNTRRMTINVTPSLFDQIDRLARALHLETGATARMLIVEALARRELYPKVRELPNRKRRYRTKPDKAR